MAILVLFEQFLRQILFKYFALNSKPFTKYDAVSSHIFHLCNCVKIIVIIEVQNYGKIIFKNVLENGW